jgi:hypothetical protein
VGGSSAWRESLEKERARSMRSAATREGCSDVGDFGPMSYL